MTWSSRLVAAKHGHDAGVAQRGDALGPDVIYIVVVREDGVLSIDGRGTMVLIQDREDNEVRGPEGATSRCSAS